MTGWAIKISIYLTKGDPNLTGDGLTHGCHWKKDILWERDLTLLTYYIKGHFFLTCRFDTRWEEAHTGCDGM